MDRSYRLSDERQSGDLWFDAYTDAAKVYELDTYICGIVRQLNRIGIRTFGSCDGHGRRVAHVLIRKDYNKEDLSVLLQALCPKRIYLRENRNSYQLQLPLNRSELLDFAENVSKAKESWLGQSFNVIKEQLFYSLLEELLSIPGASENEGLVKELVIEKMKPYVDHLTIDRAGNVIAEKTYRSGNGPTILLNAHLDIVQELKSGRKIIKQGNTWSSTKGILGADDRAGVAVLLHMAEYLYQNKRFNGKVKFIFTVEEECGLVGASQVDDHFLWGGTDAAIVVDRHGTGDVVTSCRGYIPFCHPSYGSFFEKVASEAGLNGWATTDGGSSDTRIWAEYGIQSVNLSVGYDHEHTHQESLDVKACYRTAKLLEAVFCNNGELRKVLREIKREKRIPVIE